MCHAFPILKPGQSRMNQTCTCFVPPILDFLCGVVIVPSNPPSEFFFLFRVFICPSAIPNSAISNLAFSLKARDSSLLIYWVTWQWRRRVFVMSRSPDFLWELSCCLCDWKETYHCVQCLDIYRTLWMEVRVCAWGLIFHCATLS